MRAGSAENDCASAIAIVSIILIAGIGITGYLISEDYIPVFLDTEEPLAVSSHASITDYEKRYQPFIQQIPGIDKITYEVYVSRATAEEIMTDYYEKLTSKGYRYQVNYSGIKIAEGIQITFESYLKGGTAVVIAMTAAVNLDIEGRTIVLYTTGAAWDYERIYEWYSRT